MDASTLSGSPLTGWATILKSQPNEKYHEGITGQPCKFSWLMLLNQVKINKKGQMPTWENIERNKDTKGYNKQ